MRPGLAVLTLQVALCGSVAGCALSGSGVGLVSAGDGVGSGFGVLPSIQGGLVGASSQSLTAEFGQPALLRVDGTAQVWLYHSGGCGLNLILYPDEAGTPRVALAAPMGDGVDAGRCSVALERAHAGLGLQSSVRQSSEVQPVFQPISAPVIAVPRLAAPPAAAAEPAVPGPDLEGPSSS